jgi:iron complex outermembrane receptor protein
MKHHAANRMVCGMQFRSMLLMSGALLGAMAAPAWAQDDVANPVAEGTQELAGPRADNDLADEEESARNARDVVIVTALKRETDLQDTPIALSVVDFEALEDKHIKSLLDFSDGSIPGLRVTTFESRQSAVTVGIRGIVPNDANQPAREQGVGVYLDGVYLGRQHGLNATLLDIERIEVLKGPQGTLFGRNTEGGAVHLISRKPTGEYGYRATAGFGNLGSYSADMHLDLPEFYGLSLKFDGVMQHRDAVVENPLPGAEGWGFYDRQGFKASALWKPLDGFEALYSYDTGEDQNTPYYSQLINYNPNNRPIATTFPIPAGTIAPLPPLVKVHSRRQRVADIGVPQVPSVDKALGHSLHLSWDLTPDLELRSISAYREVSADQWDNAGGANRPPVFGPNANFSRYSLSYLEQLQRSQEFQAIGSFDRIDYIVGFFYFNEKAWEEAATPSTNRWNADGTAYTINDPTPTLPGRRSLDRASMAWAESMGLYGQLTWTPPVLDDRLHITVGGRQTRDEKNGILYRVNNAATNLTFDQTNERFDPVVVAAFDATPDINFYARYSTGYRAGGASSRSLTYDAFGPEEVTAYEIGAKTYLFDNLQLNAALFQMDRENSQIDFTRVTVNPITNSSRNTVETVNAPGITDIWGFELDGSLQITDNLSLSAGYAYTQTDVPPVVNPFNGVTQKVYIIYTPENVANVALDYVHPLPFADLRVHLDATYADGSQSFEQFAQLTDSSFIVNARVSLADIEVAQDQMLSFSLWSRNLLNEQHIYRRSEENRATLGDYANFNEPRTFGIEASVKY